MIADMNKVLLTQGLKLKSASGDYIKENGAPFHLFQEYRCSLVVHVNLLDHNGSTIPHFVAWNGRTIIDHHHTHNIEVNNSYDRTDPDKSNLAFTKLFYEFKDWHITSVYRLISCDTSARG